MNKYKKVEGWDVASPVACLDYAAMKLKRHRKFLNKNHSEKETEEIISIWHGLVDKIKREELTYLVMNYLPIDNTIGLKAFFNGDIK